MSTRLIVPAIVSALLFATPVLAAGAHHDNDRGPAMKRGDTEVMTPTALACTSLQSQFDTAIETQTMTAKANHARDMRTQAGQLCDQGEATRGVAMLKQALGDIGVEPKA